MANIEISFDGNGTFRTVDFRELPKFLRRDHAFVWIDVDAGKPEELSGLQEQFSLHRIAVESALAEQQRAKITLYDDMIYLEFYGLRLADDDVRADDIGIFVGEKFIITVRRDNFPSLESIQIRWKDEQELVNGIALENDQSGGDNVRPKRKPPSSAMLLYAILDDLVDGYFPVVDWLGDEIEKLEDVVIASKSSSPNLEVQHMRTRLLRLRRLVAPEQEVLNSLLRRDVPVIDETVIPYFAEVYDHILRIHDWMESYRDQLSTIVDLQLSMQSNRLNETVRMLTAWSIILMGSTLIAGIYGMNFVHMPELGWMLGYPFALGLMLAVGFGLVVTFRRHGWW
jgi:magnesium transporter